MCKASNGECCCGYEVVDLATVAEVTDIVEVDGQQAVGKTFFQNYRQK